MKFAKKFFVGILAVAMIVSCLTLSASAADAPKLPSENLSDVLEYLLYDDPFIVEDYDSEEVGAYEPVDSFFGFTKGNSALSIVEDSSADDKALLITNNSTTGAGYILDLTQTGEFKTLYVTSFDFKAGDENGTNGSDFYVVATLNDYFENIVLFAAKTADDGNKKFSYSEYNTDRITYSTVDVEEVTPELGVWYHVEIVFSVEQSKYSITIKEGEEVIFTYTEQIDESVGISSLRYYVKDSKDAGETKTYLDEVIAYEGAAVRDVKNPTEAAAEFVAAIQALGDDSDTSIEKKLEIAELYKELFGGANPYVPAEGVKYYAEAKAAAEGYKSFINRAHADALICYAAEAYDVEGYYDQIYFYEEMVLPYYNMFVSADLETLEGMDEIFEAEVTYAEAVYSALDACDKLTASHALTKEYCDNFVKTVEEGYDPANKDFQEMVAKYSALSVLKSRVENVPEYDYAAVNPSTKYPTVADAIVAYEELEAKIEQIIYNVESVFIPAVSAMDLTQYDEVSEDQPFLTKNFESLYENYLKALTVYANGTVHQQLDPRTYPGLYDVIERFLECAEYVEYRIDDCIEFVARVNGATSSTYYITVVQQLEFVKCYFDNDKEYSLEKYAGVEEAIALYQSLIDRVAKNEKDAADYIAAVGNINLDASYLQLKAAVDAALALKADGAVTGIAGVEEANVKLAKAEAKVSSLAGHSSTLIEAVEALASATTLAERRALIFIANGAKDSAEESISGVTAAKAALQTEIQKYNDDIAAMNTLFESVVGDVTSTMSSVISSDVAALVFAVAAAIVK